MTNQLIVKVGSFLRNPRPYFQAMKLCLIASRFAIALYRRIVLPLVVRRVSRRKTVNVIFLAMNLDMWRYDRVYRRMQKDSRFNPIIVTAMRQNSTHELQLQDQRDMVKVFKERGYKVVPGFDEAQGEWVRLKNFHPDVIFYTQPYEMVVQSGFSFQHQLSSLICYSSYSFQLSRVDWNWNNPLQNYCWRHYIVGPYQIAVCSEMSVVRGKNAVTTGYSLEEEFAELSGNRALSDAVWKKDSRKRIIWAPHYSIKESEWFKVSSFLEIAEGMLEMKEKYSHEAIFAFKPHPILRTKLYDVWGKEKTERYFQKWESENSFFATGEYMPLFAGSDAMIHCSGSFIVEYLYADKPVQYVYARSRNPPDLGEIGDAALEAHYSAYGIEDIEHFVEDVVLSGRDPMRGKREAVANKYLKSPNGKMFSENVVEDILKGLGKA